MNAPFNTSLTKRIIPQYAISLILIIWILTTSFYLYFFGIVTTLEATKYIQEANQLLQYGHFSAMRFWFYSLTIFIIAAAIKTGIGLKGAFVIQAVFNLAAHLFLYKALKKIFQRDGIALFVVVYLMLFWPYQSWIVYLYTESAFYSSILLLFSALVLVKPDSVKNGLIISGALLLVVIARPLGILFLLSTYCYFFIAASKRWKWILALTSIVFIAFAYFVINAIFSTITDWNIITPFTQGCVICNLPTSYAAANLDLSTTGSPVYQLSYYLAHNFVYVTNLAHIKLRLFFLMIRNYYSASHNLFLLINIIPVYLLAIGYFFTKAAWLDKKISAFIFSAIALLTLAVALQCDDFHNRFILSVYPFFVIIAAKTVIVLAQNFSKRKKMSQGM